MPLITVDIDQCEIEPIIREALETFESDMEDKIKEEVEDVVSCGIQDLGYVDNKCFELETTINKTIELEIEKATDPLKDRINELSRKLETLQLTMEYAEESLTFINKIVRAVKEIIHFSAPK
mgnify:CR=1 FL=1|tara:strand:- start:229 stop:594 length:366 start_codon:yes stop_codon:yes gene_type:complete